MQQYFTTAALKVGATVPIQEKRIVHHVTKVMRMLPGAKFELVADGQAFLGELRHIAPESTTISVTILQTLKRQTELPVTPVIICGLPKREKAEWIVQKATELGVCQIIFFAAKRSVTRWDDKKAEKKLQRLQQIALEAGEQSHRNFYPAIQFVPDLKKVVMQSFATKLFAYEEVAKTGEHTQLKRAVETSQLKTSIACVFGPEGGIEPSEVALLTENGYQAAGLGPRILRTETAPLYFLSAISYALEL
ncbi:RNA methyltransferase, RsmE family protein [Agrilactobacillus composti DSM 18527 = JCM 14202]|uniref:Ribosomal RNA small subunit methyltransferase E n=1 Tax=Agrilactobacillus composti DSM 18527 = JCM 14202 TaxID=1423734 RepID=X0PTM8_9LACO|nr:16S rRNA (uracil(1498)-N(3))-methyltransferase [Agrilactobacillus composti]KRM36880.1 RNA methyltransferase, RsmE family protein [Agrilactobacillus composti DSM 18527 = JCM 14202]GAF41387.1 ribosomal RNA small subunit methyltransferase E [Agrilactobacillus composti DSM 18527 = JCM 14202]